MKYLNYAMLYSNLANINLYNIDMRLVQTFDDINEQIIQEIINITDTLSKPKQMSQTGGFRNYKEKYYKYKQKYRWDNTINT